MLSIRETRKYEKKRRPKAVGTPVMTRIQAELLEKLDEWRARQPDEPNRPEAIRRLIESGLKRGANRK